MNRIEKRINNELQAGRKVLSVFLTCGFPETNKFIDLALSVLDAGADLLEIGVPFSDPIADGAVIQYSSQVAINNGITLDKTLQTFKKLRNNTDKPLILMGYANPILSFGISEFCNTAKESGVDGVIIPDVPLEEYSDFFTEEFKELDKILLVSPTSSVERISKISNLSEGFIYCVSVKGITGTQKNILSGSLEYIKEVKSQNISKPVLVGFGISNPEDAKLFAEISDGIIIGSAIINSIIGSNDNYIMTLELVKNLKKSISTL